MLLNLSPIFIQLTLLNPVLPFPVYSSLAKVGTFPFSGSVFFSPGNIPVINPVILGVYTTRDLVSKIM